MRKNAVTPRAKLKKKLDTLVSLIVRKRDGKCVMCGSDQRLQCGHVFSRVHLSTRWDLENCHTQCASCNYKHELDAWPYYRWFISKFGQKRFDDLYEKHNQIEKLKDFQLEEMLEGFKNTA